MKHLSEVFEKTDMEAALAAGIFHRKEMSIGEVKEHMGARGIETLIVVEISVHIEKAPPDDLEGPFFVNVCWLSTHFKNHSQVLGVSRQLISY